ncbi:MAG: DivIVA domain-containing protein [Gemmatimonadaceae bacterium]
MTDESFHLTPVEVRRWDFGQKFRGADPIQVENFRNRVAEELERLTKVNQDLESKARGFHEQLRAFRERDKALNEALVSAQQLRTEIREQADREGQVLMREARVEADKSIDEARGEARTALEAARTEARTTIEAARIDARKLVEEASGQLRSLQTEVQQLEKSRRTFAAQLRALIERQLHELTAIEGAGELPAVTQSPPRAAQPARSSTPPTAGTPAPLLANGAAGSPPAIPAHTTTRATPASAIPNLPIPDLGIEHDESRAQGSPLKTPAWLESFSPGIPGE